MQEYAKLNSNIFFNILKKKQLMNFQSYLSSLQLEHSANTATFCETTCNRASQGAATPAL